MIQLYAKLNDLIPTETFEQVSSIAEYRDWQWSIVLNGIKYMLHVDHNGYIRDGNGRYWIQFNRNKEYVPISWQYFTGLQLNTNHPYRPYYDINPDIKAYITNRAYTEMKEVIK